MSMKLHRLAILLLLATTGRVHADEPPPDPEAALLASLPPYRPEMKVSGTIRLWTRPPRFFGPLVKAWQDGFTREQPDAKFAFTLYGTASLVGALYDGTADIAVLGEEIHPSAVTAFARTRHYDPTTIAIAAGSLDVKYFGAAMVFFVNQDNPLRRLSLAQLDGIFGNEHRRGLGNLRTWGQLGLTGEWADKPIHPYTWQLSESFCLYLQHSVLGGSHEWNPAVTEYLGGKKADGTDYPDGEQILDAVSQDRYAIGVSSLTFRHPAQHVAALALSAGPGAPAYAATKANLIDATYPLTRLIPAVIDRAPGQPIDPKVREFLRYLLSRDGQEVFVRLHGYLPLSKAEIDEQLRRLDGSATDSPQPGVDRPDSIAAPAPDASAAGTLRITGDDAASTVVQSWLKGFQALHPRVAAQVNLLGTGTGLAGIYTHTSDLAVMGRSLTSVEHDAYSFAFNKTEPLGIEVMTGSLDQSEKSAALAVFVAKDNPLTRLTLAQLDAIIGVEHRRGGQPIHTWGQLGLTGDWADKPVRAYVYDQKSGPGAFLDNRVTMDSSKWAWDQVQEFDDIAWNADGYPVEAGKQIVDALARDPFGIAVSSLRYANSQVKPLALAADEAGPYFEPTAETLIARDYPLTRAITIYLSRPPGKQLDPTVEEFLRYVLSPEGQAQVTRSTGFLPLSPSSAGEQLKKLATPTP